MSRVQVPLLTPEKSPDGTMRPGLWCFRSLAAPALLACSSRQAWQQGQEPQRSAKGQGHRRSERVDGPGRAALLHSPHESALISAEDASTTQHMSSQLHRPYSFSFAFGLEDRGVHSHAGDGMDQGQALTVVKALRIQQDVHEAPSTPPPSHTDVECGVDGLVLF